MDKTYAETQGKAPFDWNKALANPPELFTEEFKLLVDRSADWILCACGNQCAIIPRNFVGAPLDRELTSLGLDFCGSISGGYWDRAKQILNQIDARAVIVIQQELAKLNGR